MQYGLRLCLPNEQYVIISTTLETTLYQIQKMLPSIFNVSDDEALTLGFFSKIDEKLQYLKLDLQYQSIPQNENLMMKTIYVQVFYPYLQGFDFLAKYQVLKERYRLVIQKQATPQYTQLIILYGLQQLTSKLLLCKDEQSYSNTGKLLSLALLLDNYKAFQLQNEVAEQCKSFISQTQYSQFLLPDQHKNAIIEADSFSKLKFSEICSEFIVQIANLQHFQSFSFKAVYFPVVEEKGELVPLHRDKDFETNLYIYQMEKCVAVVGTQYLEIWDQGILMLIKQFQLTKIEKFYMTEDSIYIKDAESKGICIYVKNIEQIWEQMQAWFKIVKTQW
ncbi:Conserved_hypothetical protein [Hexamita inflata]|uniref:Uncharacterized protein n=1 Tax=Hexamita inflata TaxID=28002 RepID=A0AA86U706_9EUKA|nr:Conserved hypothetical protein [Hexamita inflata]